MEAFLKVHSGIPREGPGSDASTRTALRKLPKLPSAARILDLGCGPGRQTLVLARELQSRVIAVDIFQQYLDELEKSSLDAGLSEAIELRKVSMEDLGYKDESIDLVWSEGALYTVGVLKELRYLHPITTVRLEVE